jgi:hypothetical protein
VEFSFTEEQQQLRRSVREFAEGEVAPHVMEWDEASHFPMEVIPKLGEMGLLGVIFPEEYGGAGLGYIEYALAIEELSRVDGSVGIIVAAHNSLCSNHIFKFGSEEQKKKYLIPLAQGKKIGAWSLTEPEAGSDAGMVETPVAAPSLIPSLPNRLAIGTQGFVEVHSLIQVYVDGQFKDFSGTCQISGIGNNVCGQCVARKCQTNINGLCTNSAAPARFCCRSCIPSPATSFRRRLASPRPEASRCEPLPIPPAATSSTAARMLSRLR